ncbi:MAG TPA: PilZ domain-containing protein [Candidatus Acidoferrum sp.]|nr:PilZ domain-containing protein [Candidatus Acidoferrum sp.]
MTTEARRLESRTSVQVAVDLSGLDIHAVSQQGITENVSARGARVVTSQPWTPNDRVNVRSLLGSLRSRARVVYCQPLGRGSFAIGLELFVSFGEWTLAQAQPAPSHRSHA